MSTTDYKVNAVWQIKKETILDIKEEKEIESEVFQTTLPNTDYQILINDYGSHFSIQFACFDPKGNYDEEPENVMIKKMDLYINSANFQADLTIDLNANYICPATGGIRYPSNTALIEREELLDPEEKYFENDILTLELRGILSYETPDFSLGEMLWQKDDKDFTIIVGKNTIKAHKFILRQHSSILAADMNSNDIKIEHFGYSIVRAVVKLCYGLNDMYGEGWSYINFLKLIKFTNIYDMPVIKKQVEHELKELITSENVCDIANKSLELKADLLRSFCVNFLSDCIKCQKTFNGTLTYLKQEIVAEVFKKSFRHTHTS